MGARLGVGLLPPRAPQLNGRRLAESFSEILWKYREKPREVELPGNANYEEE